MGLTLNFAIDAWLAWVPALPDTPALSNIWQAWPKRDGIGLGLCPAEPNVKFIDPMMRRRLSSFGRASLAAMHEIGGLTECATPVVFASRHGDLTRTVDMLETIAELNPVSPTHFGLTVHNAVVGMAAILLKNTQPALAISAGLDTFWLGLVEAVARSQSTGKTHLYVFSDMPTPDVYQAYADVDDQARVFVCLVSPKVSEKISLKGLKNTVESTGKWAYPAELEFFRSLALRDAGGGEGVTMSMPTGRYQWSWSLQP